MGLLSLLCPINRFPLSLMLKRWICFLSCPKDGLTFTSVSKRWAHSLFQERKIRSHVFSYARKISLHSLFKPERCGYFLFLCLRNRLTFCLCPNDGLTFSFYTRKMGLLSFYTNPPPEIKEKKSNPFKFCSFNSTSFTSFLGNTV